MRAAGRKAAVATTAAGNRTGQSGVVTTGGPGVGGPRTGTRTMARQPGFLSLKLVVQRPVPKPGLGRGGGFTVQKVAHPGQAELRQAPIRPAAPKVIKDDEGSPLHVINARWVVTWPSSA